MKKSITSSLLLANVLLAASTFAADTKPVADTKLEVGIGIQGDSEGSDSDSLNSNAGLLLQVGYRLAPAYSVTGIYTYSQNVGIGGTNDETNINRFIANLNYDFIPEKTGSPYIFAGAGYEDFTNTPTDRDGMLVDVGVGYRYYFTDHIGANVAVAGKFNLDHTDRAILMNAALNYRF